MHKLLVPTDFSNYAKDALVYAKEMSKVAGCEITLLNVFPYPVISPYVYDELIYKVEKQVKMETINKLKNHWEKVKKEISSKGNNSVKINFLAVPGIPSQKIIETAKKKRSDIIIMGSKGATGIKDFFFGSTTENVLAKTACPVLTVPELAKYKPIKRILFISDLNDKEIPFIKKMEVIASAYSAEIYIMNIIDKDDSPDTKRCENYMNKVSRNLKKVKVNFEQIKSDDRIDALNVYAQVKKINLISMVTGKSSIFDIFFGTKLESKMPFHTKIPLLAYRRT